MKHFKNEYKKYRTWYLETYNTKNGINELKNKNIPAVHGVYIIRSSQPLNRVKGKSDIIYIGQSGGGIKGGKQGLGPKGNSRGRLFNTRSSHEIHVRKKIEKLFLNSKFKLEYFIVKDKKRIMIIEENLLVAYFKDHFELPPANHQLPKFL